MPRIFISYSRKDETFARRLATSLSQMGADIWIDVEDIPAGMKWSSAIQQGLDSGDLLVVIISPDSMASKNVEDEWQYYLDQGKPVIPVLLKPAKIHFQLNRIQYIDFERQPYEAAIRQLYAELQRKGVYLSPPSADPSSAYRVPPHQYPPAPARPRPNRLPLLIGLGVVGLVVVGAAIALLSNLQNTADDQTPAPPTQAAALPTNPPPTGAPTAAPTNTLPPTDTPPTDTPNPPAQPGYPGGGPVTRNADWSPVIQDFNGVSLALAPAGCFALGSSEQQFAAAFDLCAAALGAGCEASLLQDQMPQTQVCFDQPFWIGRYEITNGQYGSAGAVAGENLPRTNITWEQAQAFCESRGLRLPTEAEWEYAARGPDGLLFPWGSMFDGGRLNYCDTSCQFNWRDTAYNDGQAGPAPVGSYPGGASWVGALDMAGNVWEWTSTIYKPYPYNPADERENRADTAAKRSLRGSSWNWIAADATTSARDDYFGDFSSSDWYGFRCARSY